jgi:hypothetical protein
MVTFRVKLRFQTRASLIFEGARDGPRLAWIGGQVNRNLEVIFPVLVGDRSPR